MSAIFKPIRITWKGQEVEIVATMRVINAIENDVNLARLAQRVAQGDPPLSQISTVYAHLLSAAGVSVTPEEIYAGMYGAGDVDHDDLIGAAVAALEAVYPDNSGGTKSKKKQKQ